jgi:hypothetical protein
MATPSQSDPGARYKKLDFVDYFKAFTQTQDEWIAQLVAHPKYLAVIEAFATDRVTLGRAAFFLEGELPRPLNTIVARVLKHATRRRDLPKEDARHIVISDDIKKDFAELLPEKRVKGTDRDFWRVEKRPAGSINTYGETEQLWTSIRFDEERQYSDYWKIANREEYDGLLCNRALLARIDAFNNRVSLDMEPWDHIADIEKSFGSSVPSLEPRLRSHVLADLSGDIAFGLVDLPKGLKEEFPETYAERGII